MSRIGLSLSAVLLLHAAPLAAQDASDSAQDPDNSLTAEQVVADSEDLVGPPLPPGCESDPLNNTVVICAPRNDDQFRVPRRIDPSRVDGFGDVPRAPDAFGIPDHGVVVSRGCFIPPCPPERAIIIDLDAIPEAPPGSDADRVARGLAPRGYDGGSGMPAPEPIEETRPTPDD